MQKLHCLTRKDCLLLHFRVRSKRVVELTEMTPRQARCQWAKKAKDKKWFKYNNLVEIAQFYDETAQK